MQRRYQWLFVGRTPEGETIERTGIASTWQEALEFVAEASAGCETEAVLFTRELTASAMRRAAGG